MNYIYTNRELLQIAGNAEELVVFGAGNVARNMLDMVLELRENIVKYLLVNDDLENPGTVRGISVKKFDSIIAKKGQTVIIAVQDKYQKEIYEQLIKAGFDNIWALGGKLSRSNNEPLLIMQKLEELKTGILKCQPQPQLRLLTINILEHCNLNCAGCDHFSSIAKEKYFPLEEICRDVVRIAELLEHKALSIGVMGGEPLLHPHLPEILENVRNNFPASKIQLCTNGIILEKQKEQFWESCRKNNIVICFTKYPINLDYDRLELIVSEKGVTYEYGGGSENVVEEFCHAPLDLKGEQEPKTSFFHCYNANNCVMLSEGRLFTCTIAPNIHIFNEKYGTKLELEDGDWLDIYKAEGKEEVMNFLCHAIPFCRYCDVLNRTYHAWKKSEGKMSEWM